MRITVSGVSMMRDILGAVLLAGCILAPVALYMFNIL